jgi:transcriptional regulator with XRE-family HTH domain
MIDPMPVDIRIRFGRAIRRIREEQEINQEEAAERCGLHRTYYSGLERGVRNVSLVNIERVSRGLKTPLPELFSRL